MKDMETFKNKFMRVFKVQRKTVFTSLYEGKRWDAEFTSSNTSLIMLLNHPKHDTGVSSTRQLWTDFRGCFSGGRTWLIKPERLVSGGVGGVNVNRFVREFVGSSCCWTGFSGRMNSVSSWITTASTRAHKSGKRSMNQTLVSL